MTFNIEHPTVNIQQFRFRVMAILAMILFASNLHA
jgi:hypothetical protein